MVEVVGGPTSYSEAGHRVSGPKRVLIFCYPCLKMQSIAELRGLDTGSLVIEHTQMNNIHNFHHSESLPYHIEIILTEKGQIVPKPGEEDVQKKKIPQKTQKKQKNLWPRNKFS
jgi:hypothetical protein